MARILFAMVQETGHLNATFALARALRARGHEVRYLAFADREERVLAQGFEVVRLLPDDFPRGFDASVDERLARAGPLKGILEGFRLGAHFRAAFEKRMAPDLERILTAERPELLLVDSLLPVMAVVAHQAGTPVALVSTTLPLERMPDLAPLGSALPPARDAEGRRRIRRAWYRARASQLVARGLWRVGLGFNDAGLIVLREARRRGFPEERIRRWSFHVPALRLPELVLCPRAFDFPQAEPGPDRHYVGPTVDLERREPDFPWERLSPDKPLVYCPLTSEGNRFPHFQRFLDSVLEGMKARPGWQWVLSTGKEMHAEALRRAPADAVVVEYAPQLALLQRAAVLVCHGGLNSVREALLQGVPLVVLPCAHDQPGNAARVAYHRVGVLEEASRVTADRLTRAIDGLIGDPSYRQRAAELGRAFRENERPERALELIEALARPPERSPAPAPATAQAR